MHELKTWIIASLLTIGLVVIFPVTAQPVLQLVDTNHKISLSNQVKIFHEPAEKLNIYEVLELHDNFRWPEGINPNFGFDSKGIWLHTTVANMSSISDWVLDLAYAQNDQVDIYLLRHEEVIAFTQQGKALHNQLFRLPTAQFRLPLSEPLELYIRVAADDVSRVIPLEIQPASLHTQQTLIDSVLWGMFYGGLLVLAIYNLTLWISIREPSLMSYVIYISTVMVWQLVWGGHLQIISSSPFSLWLSQHSDLLFVLVGLCAGQFALTFLNAKETAPKVSRIIYVSMGLLVCMVPLSLFDVLPPQQQNMLVYLISMFAIVSYLYAGYESYGNNFRPARYFIFAWSLLLTTALIGMFSLLGVLPSNTFTAYCFQIGVFFEAGLFSLALMEKSRDILENKVEDVTSELRNNLEYIEEQSVILDISRKEAINASEVKSQFLANMSHEIRTPLNAIVGFSGELRDLRLPPEKSEHVNIINQSAGELLDIVNDILDFSQIESGELEINNEPFSPDAIVESLIRNTINKINNKGLELILCIEPLPDKLIGDAIRIEQILSNIIHNAIKFTDKGFVKLAITGEEKPDNIYHLKMIIEDTGIGINEEEQKKLFMAFSQLDDSLSRKYQGTGLGLVICQELVRLMHGSIQLQSEPDKGSCFTVDIRIHNLSHKLSYGLHEHWQEKRVAVMDTQPETLQALKKIFGHLGTEFIPCRHFDDEVFTNGTIDYLFVSASHGQLRNLMQKTDQLQSVNADIKVLLSQDPSPFNQYPVLRSCFDFHLQKPLVAEKLEILLKPRESYTQNENRQQLNTLPNVKVLAVDDMEINLRLINTWLKDSPVELTCCFGGQQAVDQCIEQAFDLILMDVQMPQMDGLQATKLIRQTQKNMGTPIVAVTAHAFKEEQEKLLNSGMDDYLPKPINFDGLIKIINLWCTDERDQMLSTIDWNMALQQANNNEKLARQMLHSFIEQLPVLQENIQSADERGDYSELQNLIHGLHGLSCYTGVPSLRAICGEIEGLLKQKCVEQAVAMLAKLYQECAHIRQEGEHMLKAEEDNLPVTLNR